MDEFNSQNNGFTSAGTPDGQPTFDAYNQQPQYNPQMQYDQQVDYNQQNLYGQQMGFDQSMGFGQQMGFGQPNTYAQPMQTAAPKKSKKVLIIALIIIGVLSIAAGIAAPIILKNKRECYLCGSKNHCKKTTFDEWACEDCINKKCDICELSDRKLHTKTYFGEEVTLCDDCQAALELFGL